ncbi:hypothetical protein BDR26DRAFT_873039 [Obelidium mucronatum]|nr:hypothetical protein BDR26DRAFT_873039 [Obelidium mucronatum]
MHQSKTSGFCLTGYSILRLCLLKFLQLCPSADAHLVFCSCLSACFRFLDFGYKGLSRFFQLRFQIKGWCQYSKIQNNCLVGLRSLENL